MNIALNDFQRQWKDFSQLALEAFSKVGASGHYIQGKSLQAFELNLASYLGVPFVSGVSSGLSALEIALQVLGIRPGDKVLTTPLSAFATTSAIIRCCGTPVFVDTDINGNIDLSLCEKRLELGDIRYFIPVHLYGNPLNLETLLSLKKKFPSLRIIEDCAQAIGATFHGKSCGTIGNCAALSFYPTKNLGAMGDAGAVICHNKEDQQQVHMLRDYGQSEKYLHVMVGNNARLDEIQAAYLDAILTHKLSFWTKRRKSIAKRYVSEINYRGFRPLTVEKNDEGAVWHLFPLFCEDVGVKNQLLAILREANISFAFHYPRIIAHQPVMKDVTHEIFESLSVSESLANLEVSIPIHPYLTDDEVSYIIERINRCH